MITIEKFKRFAASTADADLHAVVLEAARANSTVQTPRRLAHFLGQCYVETCGFTDLVEDLRYRTPERLDGIFSQVVGKDDALALIRRGPEAIANRVYGNRLGNGNEASGDGWRYRGSGYCHLTGKYNYLALGKKIGVDLVGNPDMARDPVKAAQIAFKFWDATGCSALADAGDVGMITERWNGEARTALKERRIAVGHAILLWGG
jgi:putative chitinase